MLSKESNDWIHLTIRVLSTYYRWKYYIICLGGPKHGDKGDFRPKEAFTCNWNNGNRHFCTWNGEQRRLG